VIRIGWSHVDDVPPDLDVLNARSRLAERDWPVDERRRIVGARLLLVALLGADGATVSLRQRCDRCGGPHGQPRLALGDRPGPRVSISHAGSIAVVALAPCAVGVDVEPWRDDIDLHDWVRTEAIAKAAGRGLTDEPLPPARVRALALDDGYVAAVATLRRWPMRISVWEVAITPR
jgi:phosphopantetheinyl transferase